MATKPSSQKEIEENVNNAAANINALYTQAVEAVKKGPATNAAPVTNSSNTTKAAPATTQATMPVTTQATGGRRKRRTHKHRRGCKHRGSRHKRSNKRTRRH